MSSWENGTEKQGIQKNSELNTTQRKQEDKTDGAKRVCNISLTTA